MTSSRATREESTMNQSCECYLAQPNDVVQKRGPLRFDNSGLQFQTWKDNLHSKLLTLISSIMHYVTTNWQQLKWLWNVWLKSIQNNIWNEIARSSSNSKKCMCILVVGTGSQWPDGKTGRSVRGLTRINVNLLPLPLWRHKFCQIGASLTPTSWRYNRNRINNLYNLKDNTQSICVPFYFPLGVKFKSL